MSRAARGSGDGRRGVGRATRWLFSGQLGLDVALALVLVLGANWLSGRPLVRQRFDWTEKGTNSISDATRGILDRLEGDDPVEFDVFWRGEEFPLEHVGAAAMDRVFHLLQMIQAEASGRVRVRSWDRASREAIQTRLAELRLTGYENCVVVSRGDRREVLRLRGDLAHFELGDPRPQVYRPPSIRAFVAEDTIAQALLRLTRGESIKISFTQGQGEAGLEDHDAPGISRLKELLAEEAMEVEAWSWERDAALPADAAALVIAAPDTPFPPAQLDAIRAWIDSGGRLIVAAHAEAERLERSDVPELLAGLGIEVLGGLVMNEGRDALGQVSMEPELVVLVPVGPSGMQAHPITNPLRDAGRRVVFSRVHPMRVRAQPALPRVGTSLALLDSPFAWLDLPPPNYYPDSGREEVGKFPLCVVSRFVPDSTQLDGAPGREQLEARVVALGSVSSLANGHLDYNADFARNLFRWVTSREYRLGISPRDPDQRRLPAGGSASAGLVTRVALWWIPGACFVLGMLTAVARSRGGPGRKQRSAAAGAGP